MMKMKIGFFAVVLLLVLTSCAKEDEDAFICMDLRIEAFMADQADNQLARIDRYTFQGETVYVFDEGIPADGTADVFMPDCELLCVIGGLLGDFQCNGGDFGTEATDQVTIWEN